MPRLRRLFPRSSACGGPFPGGPSTRSRNMNDRTDSGRLCSGLTVRTEQDEALELMAELAGTRDR